MLLACTFVSRLDRTIFSILAEEVKRDLDLSDAQVGFLYGTAFAVVFAVFGIPFGRLADAWTRKKVIAFGLFCWSVLTMVSATARSFGLLAGCRVGIGIAQASLAPSAYSLLVALFPAHLRATALALYSSGAVLGAGLSFFLGGWILDTWRRTFPSSAGPLGLEAWRAALLIVGLPGVVLALGVLALREPRRERERATVARAAKEFAAVIPPLTLFGLWRDGAPARQLVLNLAAGGFLTFAAWVLSALAGEGAQWAALAAGLYAAASWAQGLRLRDPECFVRVFRSHAFLYSTLGFASLSFVTDGFSFWTAPYLLRAHDASPSRIGAMMAVGIALGGWIGVTAGGVLSDRLKARSAGGRVEVGILSVVLGVPAYVLMVRAPTLTWAAAYFLLLIAVAGLWLGPGAASVNELVPARMRSTAVAVYLLLSVMIGDALGPFAVGKMSDALAAAGQEPARALGNAMLASTLVWLPSIALLWRSRRYIATAETTSDARA